MDNIQSEDRNSMKWISDLIQFQWESVIFSVDGEKLNSLTKHKLFGMMMDEKKRWFVRNKRLFTPPKLHTFFQGITSVIIGLVKRVDHLHFLVAIRRKRIPLCTICVWILMMIGYTIYNLIHI